MSLMVVNEFRHACYECQGFFRMDLDRDRQTSRRLAVVDENVIENWIWTVTRIRVDRCLIGMMMTTLKIETNANQGE